VLGGYLQTPHAWPPCEIAWVYGAKWEQVPSAQVLGRSWDSSSDSVVREDNQSTEDLSHDGLKQKPLV
jgi:hypothetical protein